MHPVDGDKFLGERIRRRVMIGLRSDDTAKDFAVVDEADGVLQVAFEQAVPVGVHRGLDDRMRQDRRRPLDGVDLGDERRGDQPRLVEELLVGPVRVLGGEEVAHMVVFPREERVEHGQADPPVVGEAADADAADRIDRQQAGWLDLQFAADHRPHFPRGLGVAAIQL
jgi:hypothetical protein